MCCSSDTKFLTKPLTEREELCVKPVPIPNNLPPSIIYFLDCYCHIKNLQNCHLRVESDNFLRNLLVAETSPALFSEHIKCIQYMATV